MRLRSSARRPYPDVPQPSQEVGSAPSRARSTRGTTAPPSLVSSRAPPSSVPATTISGPSTTTATALPAPSSSSAHAPSIGSQAVDTSTANGRHWGSGSFAIHLSTSATPISSTTDIPPIHSPRPAVLPTVEAETRAGTPFQLSLTICAIPSRCVRVHREGNGGMEIMLSNGLLSGKRKCRLGVANTRPSSRPSRKRRAKTTSGRLDSNDIHIQWRRQCGRLLMSRTKTKSSTRLGAKAQAQGERAAAANDETTPTSPHNESQSGGVPAPLPRQERDEVDDDLEAVERALLIEPSSMTRDTSAAAALPLFQSVTSHSE
ncbi:hypothetical protein I317_07124 [Kwoniella heveanensis CBS 569]|nr:hypothetical protein I317_07124 [Kwoniella heveanensis CBS 569]